MDVAGPRPSLEWATDYSHPNIAVTEGKWKRNDHVRHDGRQSKESLKGLRHEDFAVLG